MIVAIIGEWEGQDSQTITEVTVSDSSQHSSLHSGLV